MEIKMVKLNPLHREECLEPLKLLLLGDYLELKLLILEIFLLNNQKVEYKVCQVMELNHYLVYNLKIAKQLVKKTLKICLVLHQ